jgi:nucleoside-diphosphate-sugar epimerase
MAHHVGRAARLARMAVEIAWCDLKAPDQVRKAVEGCDVVVHCAYGASQAYPGERRRVTVQGTRNLLNASLAAGVERFVHISTIAVFSYDPPDGITETSQPIRSGEAYCDDKIDAEEAVRRGVGSGLNAIVLRMGNIYGPYSGPWTVRPLNHIRTGQVTLVGDGQAEANMVYVDNAVEAVLGAIAHPAVTGEALFVVDEAVSWFDFYSRYAAWMDGKKLVAIPREELQRLLHPAWSERLAATGGELWREVLLPAARYAAFRAAGSRTLGAAVSALWRPVPGWLKQRIIGDPSGKSIPAALVTAPSISMPPLGLLRVYAGKTSFPSGKTRQLIGYGPRVDLEKAMEITRCWAAWARLI